jgi:hypothetical protein
MLVIIIWWVDHTQCIPWDRYRPHIVLYIWGIPVCVCVRLYVSAFLNGSTSDLGGTFYRSWYVSWAIYFMCVHNARTCARICEFEWISQFAANIWFTTSGMGYVLFMFTHSVQAWERARVKRSFILDRLSQNLVKTYYGSTPVGYVLCMLSARLSLDGFSPNLAKTYYGSPHVTCATYF